MKTQIKYTETTRKEEEVYPTKVRMSCMHIELTFADGSRRSSLFGNGTYAIFENGELTFNKVLEF